MTSLHVCSVLCMSWKFYVCPKLCLYGRKISYIFPKERPKLQLDKRLGGLKTILDNVATLFIQSIT